MLVDSRPPSTFLRSPWFKVLIALGIVLVLLIIWANVAIQRAEPRAREKVVSWLEAKFDSDVELGSLKMRLLPQPHVVGRDLKLRWKRRTDIPTMVAIDEFQARLDWADLVRPDWHIGLVRLTNFTLNIPPRSQNPPEQKPKGDSDTSGVASSIVVDQVVADHMVLRMIPREANKEPKEFDLYKLRIREAGAGRQMKYETEMKNYKPPGLIRSVGEFGPWNTDEPGATPLSGDYTFSNADLGVFKGIAGILSSTGNFHGTLNRIEVEGKTETPDFRLTMVGNRVPLKTTYQAIVDGTSGTTELQPVNAILGETPMTVTGAVVAEKGVKGKNIELKATIRNGRFQDLLQLAVKGGAPMTGLVSLATDIGIPRGEVDVIEKLNLKGNVEVHSMKFTNPDIQGKIDGLSRRGQGRPEEEDIQKVPSKLTTAFSLDQSVLAMPRIDFDVSGASAEAQGTFNMRSQEMDFDGVLRLDAKPSETVAGLKSFFLKAIDPLVTRNGKGTVLSFNVTGTRDNPKFGLDVGRTLKKKD